jgi:hypothetical protein
MTNVKKIYGLVLGLCVSVNAFAACGYIDRMTVVSPSDKFYKILSLHDQGMVRVVPVNSTQFDIVDVYGSNDTCVFVDPGYAYVRVGDEKQENYCDLVLKDSPYIWEPKAKMEKVQCYGSAQYVKIDKTNGVPAVTKYQWYDIVMS